MGKDYIKDGDHFQRKHLEKKRDIVPVALNPEEREILDACKLLIEQSKDSTALKTLAFIGAKVIHSSETKYIIEVLFKNKRNNKRLGIAEFE